MAATILAVSEDEAFSTMLQEGLENAGAYHVVMARSGEDARRAAASRRLDLMIVDADLEHTLPSQLVTEIRGFRPHLRLMWMLYLGQDLPQHLATFEAHGLLTKPFFIEDLGRQVEAALGHPPAADATELDVAAAPLESADAPTNAGTRPEAPTPPPDPVIATPPVGATTPPKAFTPSDPVPEVTGAGGLLGRTRPTTRPPDPGPVVAAPLVGADTPRNADPRPAVTEPDTGAGTRPPTNRREPGGSGIVLGSDRPSGPARTPSPSPTPPARTSGKTGPLGTGLHALARSLNAEAALLLDLEGRVVAWSGFASRRMAPELAVAIAAEFAAAKRVAGILRGRDGNFLTHIHEGNDFWLFSVFMWESNLILSVAVRADVPLGTVRYQVRQAATELSRYARK